MSDQQYTPPLKYAMVGGGSGSFIGAVHRKAAALDGRAELVAGALSSTPERSLASAREIGLEETRAYASWQEMLERESARPEGERPDFVSVVTPNDTHYPIAKAALEAGLHVVCDKPFTHTVEQAAELRDLAASKNLVCCVTYNYSGYPMVREASELVRTGALGPIRKVHVEYHQGWLATKLEDTGMKQASWRTDPKRAGLGGALGDIGTHAEQLVRFVTDLEIDTLYADCTSFVDGRALDDDASVLLRFAERDGVRAKGVMTVSQVCTGEGNPLTLRVYGERGGLRWKQETPETLTLLSVDSDPRTLSRGNDTLSDRAQRATRLPGGHPEGFIEAFANIYLGAIEAIELAKAGQPVPQASLAADIPQAQDGLEGVRFVERCVSSDGAWVPLNA